MVPLPASGTASSDSESEEAEPAPSDSEEEAFLSNLAQALAREEPPAKRLCAAHEVATAAGISPGVSDWPVEVKSAIASFLPWRELPRWARISQSWRLLENSDTVWKEYFRIEWPRLFHRRTAAHPHGGVQWGVLFRKRWAEPNRHEDAEQEDWNDFTAALDLWKGSGSLEQGLSKGSVDSALPEERQIHFAVIRFKEDHLRLHGVSVPALPLERGAAKHCAQRRTKCRHRPVPIAGKLDGCIFVCECCAEVHVCRPMVPCEGAEVSGNNEFLVCPVSGICSDPVHILPIVQEEGAEAAHDWDPNLSSAQQHGRWFEQGYFMDDDEADEFFDDGCGRRHRRKMATRGCASASQCS